MTRRGLDAATASRAVPVGTLRATDRGMSYRDQLDAMQARVEELERALDDAHDSLSRLRHDRAVDGCLSCGRSTEPGTLLSDTYPLRWLPEGHRLFLGVWARGCDAIGGAASGSGRGAVAARRCTACRRIVVAY